MTKVLIVDDSRAEVTQLRGIFDAAGWTTVVAYNGNEAVDKAKSEKPNLILMDVLMPEMDGFEACRVLQSDEATKHIPVIFVTSKNQKADQLWAKMQGGKALIGKPYHAQDVLAAAKAFG